MMRANLPFAPATAALLVAMSLAGCAGAGGSGTLAADFVATTTDNQSFSFDASPSTGSISQYLWDFGDGNTGEGKTTTHTYEYINGAYDVTLTVVDGDGVRRLSTQEVMTGTQPNRYPGLVVTVDKRWVRPNEEVLIDARQSFDLDGDPFTLTWNFNYAILAGDELNMINLGAQQYGQENATLDGLPTDAGSQPGASGPSSETQSPGSDPARAALEETQARSAHIGNGPLLGEPEVRPQHGGHAGFPYSGTFIEEFDGRSNSTSPMQFYSWPTAGLYFVRIDARDVKGDTTTGFLAIQVSSNAPRMLQDEKFSGTLDYAGPDLDNDLVFNTQRHTYGFPYAGRFTLTVNLTQALDADVSGVVCRSAAANNDFDTCMQNNLGADGPDTSLLEVEFDYGVSDFFTKFYLYLRAFSETPSGRDIQYEAYAVKSFDTNPWYNFETNPVAATA